MLARRLTILAAALVVFASTTPAAAQTPPAPTVAAPRAPTTEVREPGLIADYFSADPAAAVTSPGAVIVLGGSEGGLGGSRNLARRLAREGFDAVAVSYFGEAGQSARLDQIPIEPVARAREWLQARPGHHGPIAVVGVSKGGELALLTASRDPQIRAVVAGVPSNVVWQGIDQTGGDTGSSWTAGGAPLDYVRYDLSQGFNGIHKLYVDSLVSAPAEAEIPVERINGPVLMISGAADGLWPSSEMSARVERRLQAHGFTHAVTHIAYPDAGHAVFGPPVARDAPGLERVLSVGGTIDGLVAARADGWPRVIAFLREVLGAPD